MIEALLVEQEDDTEGTTTIWIGVDKIIVDPTERDGP
jgi:hypothetical protein